AHGLALALPVPGGLEQPGEEVGVEVLMLGHQQVFHRGHVLEQAHVLKGAHHALAGDAMAGQALDRLAVQADFPGGGPVEAVQAVEHGGLAGAVGADHRHDLPFPHGEVHLVDGQQSAEAHAQAPDFQQRAAHGFNSRCGRCMGNRPCGRQIIMTIMVRPKISMRYSLNSRISCSITMTTAAKMMPSCEPMPPSTTMARIIADSMKVKDSGVTSPWRAA